MCAKAGMWEEEGKFLRGIVKHSEVLIRWVICEAVVAENGKTA